MTEESNVTDVPETSGVNLPSFYGVKAGMTRVFNDTGDHVPVTVIKLVPNYISQVKTKDKDGHEAYQVAYYEKRENLVNRPTKGHLTKANIDKTFARFAEVKADEVNSENLGKEVSISEFAASTFVDITGTTKGKGFQGVMKRYGFKGGPAAHGSHFHRRPGSIGNRATPGKVFAGKKMPGRMGGKVQTVQNMMIQEVNMEKGYMLIRGSVPGPKNGFVRISKAKKK